MKTKLIAVAGPTASGKTSLSVSLARRIGGEVISNDSMQIYRGMEIGTAAPTQEEMMGVAHHMIGCVSPSDEFSCADYANAAKKIISEVCRRKNIPVFCGGTGLYLDAVLSVDSFSDSTKDSELRAKLMEIAENEGAAALHARLAAVDPDAAAAIHANNVRRVIRAIEIYETTGITKTKWDQKSKADDSPYDAAIVVLEYRSRQLLYSRIDKRVDLMIAAGLEAEAHALWEMGLLDEAKPAFQAIGYKEFIPYFSGEASPEEAIAKIKQSSRRYAKRQITWFKRYADAIRIVPDREDGTVRDTEDICEEVIRILKERNFTV